MLYLQAIPFDLIKELSCYFNHSTTQMLIEICNIHTQIQNHIWKYKINKELNYDFDKTVLPLDQKYLEIKACDDIDIGCEVFIKDLTLAYYRAAKKSNPVEWRELLDYLQNLPIVQSMEDIRNCEIAILAGALEVNNKELIDEYKHYLIIDGQILQSETYNMLTKSGPSLNTYHSALKRLIASAYYVRNEQVINGFNEICSRCYIHLDIRTIDTHPWAIRLIRKSHDHELIKHFIELHSISLVIEIYVCLLELKRFAIADLLYETKIISYDKHVSELNNDDMLIISSALIMTDDIKYITLAQEWLCRTSIFILLNSKFMTDNLHKFYNLKNKDLIWSLYIEPLAMTANIQYFLDELMTNAFNLSHLDYVEWVKEQAKKLYSKYGNINAQLLEKIKQDKSRVYPQFLWDYIEHLN